MVTMTDRTTVEQSGDIWEKLGAAEGLWAATLLALNAWLLAGTQAVPGLDDDAFADALRAERMAWEWMTFLRIVAGLMIVWWMGSLAGRLRLAEGEPGRLATIAFGVGTVWGALWLLSALFNSAAILFAAEYANPAAARIAGTLASESVYILTPSITVALTFAVALVGARFGGFPAWYTWTTWGASGLLLVLALIDWYGTGSLSEPILAVGLAWMALTSAVLIPTYRAADPVLGARRVRR